MCTSQCSLLQPVMVPSHTELAGCSKQSLQTSLLSLCLLRQAGSDIRHSMACLTPRIQTHTHTHHTHTHTYTRTIHTQLSLQSMPAHYNNVRGYLLTELFIQLLVDTPLNKRQSDVRRDGLAPALACVHSPLATAGGGRGRERRSNSGSVALELATASTLNTKTSSANIVHTLSRE